MNHHEATSIILHYLKCIRRPGVDRLIDYIQSSNYLSTARCYGHHRYDHGLMFHSLEVLDCMLKNNRHRLPVESIVLAALCHDLGKAVLRGSKIGHGAHPGRSLYILNRECGMELTRMEASAVRGHHVCGRIYEGKRLLGANPLLRLLRQADRISTDVNKRGERYIFSSIVKRHRYE